MSLIVGIRAAQGLVLATDSMTSREDATFFTARKLFTFPSQPHLAVAICGLLSLGRGELRSVAVLMDTFSSELDSLKQREGNVRIPTAMFAAQLGEYLSTVWQSCMLPEDDDTLELVVAGYDVGMPYGEIYWLSVPNSPAPQPQRLPGKSFFAAYWGDTAGVRGMVDPYEFPFDIMPLQDAATLAAHLITSTAQLEAWSTKRQSVGGPVQLVIMTQSGGGSWFTPAS
jgi:hypothetical protein